MSAPLLDDDVLETIRIDDFDAATPFPWAGTEGLLSASAFDALRREFPSRELFSWHEGLPRVHGQRPHDRYHLAYASKPYEQYEDSEHGVASRDQLPEVWCALIDELESSAAYRKLIVACLGRDDLLMRYAWHVGVRGSEVSPHQDDERKAGTHIFYFNTEDDWDVSWGGSTLLLDGRSTASPAPDFTDFAAVTEVDTLGNRTMLFRNQREAWHGVEALRCPDGSERRLFNVILEYPDHPDPRRGRLRRRVSARGRALRGR